METPSTVAPNEAPIYEACVNARGDLKALAQNVNQVRAAAREAKDSEVVANVTLAFRHLEDASMRLGKAMQALDGGVSVYDKATTVGAPS